MVLTEDPDPRCDRCGAPITTGLMAAFCPHRERCEFWPEDEASQQFLDDMGLRISRPAADSKPPNVALSVGPLGEEGANLPQGRPLECRVRALIPERRRM